jgi:hypothetical protein
MKRQLYKAMLGAALVLVGTGAGAETFRCDHADGRITFQGMPCPLGSLAETDPPPAVAKPAPPPVIVPAAKPAAVGAAPQPAITERPAPAPVRAAAAPAAPAAPAAAPVDEGFIKPTRRKREVLEITAQLERCRADAPGFAEKSGAVQVAWNRRHAGVISEYASLVAAKVRASRRGEATLPVRACTDEWLLQVEALAQAPDARFSTVEKTWQVFMGALMTGDRATALNCLAGKAGTRWKDRVQRMSDDDLRRIAATIRALKVQWGDDYEKEGVIADTDNRVVGIAFRNLNEEWKITDWGGAAVPLAAP